MKSDQTSDKRATLVSLIGLSIQGALALVVLLYSLKGGDIASLIFSIYLMLGLPVWLALALVFHQQRLERIEAVEVELLQSATAAQASVFQEAGSEMRVASKKLAWMHRFLLPGISLLVGVGLIGFGLLAYSRARPLITADSFSAPKHTGWAIAIGLIVAVVGFIFARFVAGMAKADTWANLRAGATWVVGASVFGLLLAIAHGVSNTSSDAFLRNLSVIFPIIMIVLGAEIFLNFVLSVYRPRKPGETPRAAFDSRILGFLAAPDRIAESISEAINYQFGLDVSSMWFYQLLSRSIAWLTIGGGLAIWSLTSIVVVQPEEKALILHTGRLVRSVDSGVRWKLPWPLETVHTIPALAITEVQLSAPPHATEDGAPILWKEDHGVDERYLLVRSSRSGSNTTGQDDALVSAEIPLQYIVEDVLAYHWLAADSSDPADPDKHRRELLKVVAMREVMEFLATQSIDDVLGSGRNAINRELHRRITDRFATMTIDPSTGDPRGAGVRIVFVGIVGAHPPYDKKVAESFEYVVLAEQRRRADVEMARATAIATLASVAGDADRATQIVNDLDELEQETAAGASEESLIRRRVRIASLIDDAGGEAAGLLFRASADRWVRQMDFKGRAARQEGRAAIYRAAPEVYLAGLYLQALRESVRNSRLFITTFEAPNITLNFDQVESTFENLIGETRAEQP